MLESDPKAQIPKHISVYSLIHFNSKLHSSRAQIAPLQAATTTNDFEQNLYFFANRSNQCVFPVAEVGSSDACIQKQEVNAGK